MKIQPITHRLIELQCGELTIQIEHFSFSDREAVHVMFQPTDVTIRSYDRSGPCYSHGGHIVVTKDKEKKPNE